MEFHTFANVFPLMDEYELQSLADDIRENGQREKITIFGGKILDGRNRYTACTIAGVEPKTEEFDGNCIAALSFVWSQNYHRRHLTSGQAAACAVEREELDEQLKAAAAKRHREGSSKGGKARQKIDPPSKDNSNRADAQLASATGTNRQYIADARKLKDEAPELHEKVKRKELTIQDAKREHRKQKQNDEAKEAPWPQFEQALKDRLDAGEAIVVNVDRQNHIVSYARERGLLFMVDRSSKWGNVFVLNEDGDRNAVCTKYAKHYLPHKDTLIGNIGNLKGKALGCHCSPKQCHADEIARLANACR